MKESNSIRILNLGKIEWYKTQTIYHALAELMNVDSSDTIIICKPDSKYLCTGYHQDYKKIFDVEYCKNNNLPIVHRKIGGGATYLDESQLFYQFIFKQSSLPKSFADIFSYLLEIPKMTLNKMGIECTLNSTNELEVDNRRIAGTGGGFINDSCVVVGNYLFDFDYETMTNVWNLPINESRILAKRALTENIITLSQLDSSISSKTIEDKFIESVKEKLKCDVHFDNLTDNEITFADKMKDELVIDELNIEKEMSSFIEKPLKISANSYIVFETFMIKDRAVQFAFYTNKGIIVDVQTETEIPSLNKLKKIMLGSNINDIKSAMNYFKLKFRSALV